MKKCGKCNKNKFFDDFAKNASSKIDGLQSFCKICTNKESKKWYLANKNKPEVISRIQAYDRQRVRKFKEILDAIKVENGCLKCGELDACCLDFHHKANKEEAISDLVRKKNKDRIFSELKKCIVLCASCHRKFHAGRFTIDSNFEIKISSDFFTKSRAKRGTAL